MQQTEARDAWTEAIERARPLRGADIEVQILEPAPPAVNEQPWFADAEPDGEKVVRPFGPPELRWQTLAAEDESLGGWCQERWLGPYRRLEPLPADFGETREALHELAEQVISPAREKANTKIGLRWTLGGFGTPFFGADAQVRVERGQLVVQEGATVRIGDITTLADSRRLLGALAADPSEGEREKRLAVEESAASRLGEFYGFASSVLEELRHEAAKELDHSRVQLWPEHFDVSVELGSEAAGQRASYGASPGDGEHPMPYLYVLPWGQVPGGERWQAHGFSGAELGYARLLEASDQRAQALEFFRACLADLVG